MSLRPLKGQVLVRMLPNDEFSDGGIFLPDIAHDGPRGEKKKPGKAMVISLGPFRTAPNGFAILPECKPGDTVLISYYAGTKLDRTIGESLRLLPIDDVLAVLTNGENGENLAP